MSIETLRCLSVFVLNVAKDIIAIAIKEVQQWLVCESDFHISVFFLYLRKWSDSVAHRAYRLL